jgi:BirA family transcriptional regulator, biotin operon repressor / biotin---[acetyl-CoA-carboxylase] ligase
VSQMRSLPDGIATLYFTTIDSTNDEVRRHANQGALGPLWVRAATQTNGRGRRGRSWLSEPGNLFMTGLLTLDYSPQEAANLSFVAALAVAEAIENYVPPHLVDLKWPNDVLIDGHKSSGILLESWTSQAGLQIAIGIGINVVTPPANIDQKITCIGYHQIPDSNRCEAATLFEFVLRSFHYWLALWREQGFYPVREAWLSKARGLGQPIVARLPHETLEGIFVGLGHDGALEIEMLDGTRRHITAGDVFFADEGGQGI